MNTTTQDRLFEFDIPDLIETFGEATFRSVSYQTARALIVPNHYLHSMGSTTRAFGMYLADQCSGVATFGTIPGPNAKGICGPQHKHKVLELTRLFIFDWVGKNAESLLIGQCFKLLKREAMSSGGMALISYADTGAGHVGTVYQATNWLYTGAVQSDVCITTTGEVLHSRVASDARRGASSAGMERMKTDPKHRYVTFLGTKAQVRELRKALQWPILPYPKICGTGLEGETPDFHSGRPGSIPGCRSTSEGSAA